MVCRPQIKLKWRQIARLNTEYTQIMYKIIKFVNKMSSKEKKVQRHKKALLESAFLWYNYSVLNLRVFSFEISRQNYLFRSYPLPLTTSI